MTEPKKDVKVWLRPAMHALLKARCEGLPGEPTMGAYIEQTLGLNTAEASALRRRYWLKYGATLLGLVRHHGVKASHFLHDTHLLPGLEARDEVAALGLPVSPSARSWTEMVDTYRKRWW